MSRCLCSCVLLISHLMAAVVLWAGGAASTPEPSNHALYHFIRQAAYLSRKAAALDEKDGTGASLRHAFSSTVGLSDSEAATVLVVASDLDAQFAALDQQAAKIIANAKAHNTAEGLIAPPPPELATLQQQKTAVMNTLRPAVVQGLSPEVVAAIDNHLRRMSNRSASPPAQ